MNLDRVVICTDGAARGNPGPAAIGVIIKDGNGRTISRISRRIGVTTNNQAEYQAIIAALEKATSFGARSIDLRSDSELVVQQIGGRYRIKNTALRQLYLKVVRLISFLDTFTISYIPRARNAEADALANKALDKGT